MSEQLVIRLGSVPQQSISWLVWAAQQQEVIASGELSGAEELPELAQRLGQRPVIALVPAADVQLKQVALPAKPNRQLMQALPYMLEEEQAEDIEQLFLATAACELHDGQYQQQVAICRRDKLEQWLSWLQSAGFSVSRMLPDALLLPEQQLPACIQLHEQWLLKQQRWQVAAVDLARLQARFGVSYEQAAHRLTTLARPTARGVPFFLMRVDQAGNISKRYAAGAFPFSRFGGACPRWRLHSAFRTPGRIITQIIETPAQDGKAGGRWFTFARTVERQGRDGYGEAQDLAVGLGCELRHAHRLAYAHGLDLERPEVTPIDT